MPKIVNHEERRQVFAFAAKEAIAKLGIESVRLVDVARSAGATTGSLGHYFEDKDDLIDAALEQLVAEWDDQLNVGDGSLFDAAMQFMPQDEESTRDARVWIAFVNRSLVSESAAKKMSDYWEIYHSRMSRYLQRVEGKNRKEADTLAHLVGSVVDGMVVRACSDPENWPPERQRELMEAALLQLVGPSALTVPE